MSIDRRKAILTLMCAWTAMAVGQRKTDPDAGFITYNSGSELTNPQTFVNFGMDSFKGFTFTRKGETITLTPDEIWEALGGKP